MKAETCWDYEAVVSVGETRVTKRLCAGYRLCPGVAGEEGCQILVSGSGAEGTRAVICPGKVAVYRGVLSPYPVHICGNKDGGRIAVRVARRRGCLLVYPGYKVLAEIDGASLRLKATPTYPLTLIHAKIQAESSLLADAIARLLLDCYTGLACAPKRIAVAFSGGLDSSLLAFLASRYCNQKVVLYAVTAEGRKGVGEAREAARLLDLELEIIELGKSHAEELLGRLHEYYPPKTPMEAALELGFAAVAERAAREKLGYVVVGQLADELFGGYKKYEALMGDQLALEHAMLNDIKAAMPGLGRDSVSFIAFGVVPIFPYTCRRLVSHAVMIPPASKLLKGVRKHVLRLAAARLGLPGIIATRPKKAFQYSSGLEKLVKKAGLLS